MFGFFSKKPPPEASKDEVQKFRRKIRGSLVKSALGDKKFLPRGEVSKLVTEKTVKNLLPQASPSLVEFVCRRAQKAFLTVLWHNTNLHAIMESFQSSGLTDKYLPIGDPKAENGPCGMHDGGTCKHAKALDVFHDWDDHEFSDFYKDQWTFCSPIFGKGGFRQELHANYILPFTWVSDDQKDGHFSSVFEAKLHADHHQDDSKTNVKYGQGNHVALKKLKRLRSEPGYNVETAWESEAAALHQISELRHKHLIGRKGAFKHGTECFIMFEWADGGTLRDVWQREATKRTELNGDRIMEVLEQLVGLAGALSKLHNTNTNTKTARMMSNKTKNPSLEPAKTPRTLLSPGRDNNSPSSSLQVPQIRFQPESSDEDYYNSDNPDDANEEHWRHGDLRPDNILQFRDSTWLGTLKIADFGLAKQHALATSHQDEHTQRKYSTSQYEAPEVITNCNLRLPRSRRHDIWSMGCIILEFAIWLLYGYDGLDKFYKEREHINALKETLYFTVDSIERTAQLSNIAKGWMDYMLQFDPECNGDSPSVLGDLIKLVKDRLLVVALPQDRMTELALKECRADAEELEEINETHKDTPDALGPEKDYDDDDDDDVDDEDEGYDESAADASKETYQALETTKNFLLSADAFRVLQHSLRRWLRQDEVEDIDVLPETTGRVSVTTTDANAAEHQQESHESRGTKLPVKLTPAASHLHTQDTVCSVWARCIAPFWYGLMRILDPPPKGAQRVTYTCFQLMPVRTEIYAGSMIKPEIPDEKEVLQKKTYEYQPVPLNVRVLQIPAHELLRPGPHLNCFWRNRFPKKRRNMLLWDEQSECLGWGIHIVEDWNKPLANFLALLTMMSFGLFVTIYGIVVGDWATGATIGSFLVTVVVLYCTLRYQCLESPPDKEQSSTRFMESLTETLVIFDNIAEMENQWRFRLCVLCRARKAIYRLDQIQEGRGKC
ncbi:hypothetical protein ACJ41O_008760 [Fusarium nematophilum]